MPRFAQLMSPSGRIRRKDYWLFYILLPIGVSIAIRTLEGAVWYLAYSMDVFIRPIFFMSAIAGLVLAWITTAGVVKRLHDFDWSGGVVVGIVMGLVVACLAVAFFAFVGAVFGGNSGSVEAILIMLAVAFLLPFALVVVSGVVPGDSTENRFGPPPEGLDRAADVEERLTDAFVADAPFTFEDKPGQENS